MHTVLDIGRHYMISYATCKIEKGQQFLRTFGNFDLPNAYGVNIC